MNIVIGKNSNLSYNLNKGINNTILISSKNIMEELDKLHLNKYTKLNIIFNNFQTATKLNDISEPIEYINRSIMITAKVLEYIAINTLDVNKIIYTSSSSVYGNNILCKETDKLNPLSLHSSLKISNEHLIEKFAIENKIDYTITRIFNMYGGDDNFSIISKIKKSYLENSILTIVNNGNAIRDFIHINDVVKIYKTILELKDIPKINIGSGQNISIKNIINFLSNNNIYINMNNIFRDELKISSADISNLLDIMGDMEFIKVENFLLEEILEKNNE